MVQHGALFSAGESRWLRVLHSLDTARCRQWRDKHRISVRELQETVNPHPNQKGP